MITIGGVEIPVGKLVLSPTRTYMPILNEIFKSLKSDINGIIHCSGGGQTKVIKFLNNVKVIKDNLFPVPPLFDMIQSESKASWREMYQVFNMGHRMELYVDNLETANEIIKISKSFNVDAQIVGSVEASSQAEVFIKSPFGEFSYRSLCVSDIIQWANRFELFLYFIRYI